MSVMPLTLPRPLVDAGAFREAMARLASGVAVAAVWDGETPRGLLVSSLTALSTEPPRVLFCVKKTASAHGSLLAAKECGLSLLAEDDQGEAERFSRSDLAHERFQAATWRLDRDRPPEHLEGLVRLSGAIDQKIDAGSHSIFILRVSEAEASERTPLVYFGRDFHRLLPLREQRSSIPASLEPSNDRSN
jgi:flavin reductase (DIM6/NTAB) family NADH-FMN oxidoreductase RutF